MACRTPVANRKLIRSQTREDPEITGSKRTFPSEGRPGGNTDGAKGVLIYSHFKTFVMALESKIGLLQHVA